MTYTISKDFEFSAAHYLKGLPLSHKCARLHGHNYKVRVEITAIELDDVGFVLDYGELDGVKHMIDERLDHKCLNDIMDDNPTAELLARWLWDPVNEVIAPLMKETHSSYMLTIHVSETPKTWASFDGAG